MEAAWIERPGRDGERTRFKQLGFKPPKSGKPRRVALAPIVAEALREHRVRQAERRLALGPAYRDEGLVICREDGARIDPESFTPSFRTAAAKAGFPGVNYHALRHTAASVLMALGVHPKVVQEQLGHHSAAFTLDRYSHVAPTLQEAAALSLDAALRAAGKGGGGAR